MKVIDRRMHNKVYVVDGGVEVIGGRNIGSESPSYWPGTCSRRLYRLRISHNPWCSVGGGFTYSVVANPG